MQNSIIYNIIFNLNSYFDRDVGCVERFFRKRFGLLSPELPKLKDIVKERDLDIEVEASGFTKVEREQLENVFYIIIIYLLFR